MKKEDADKMTVQEACDFAVQQIAKQGSQCMVINPMNGAVSCLYGTGNKHCAVGWLLDETNKFLMDFLEGVEGLCMRATEDIPDIIQHNINVFDHLQQFHDSEGADERRRARSWLEQAGIDTSAPQWGQWVGLAK